MSNTRHAKPGSPLSPNRFASSRETARELHGNLGALRCATLERAEDRELVFALQSVANESGLENFVEQFLEKYSARVGTRSMRKFGITGKHYDAERVKAVRNEMECGISTDEFLLRGEPDSGSYLALLRNDSGESYRRKQVEADERPTSYPVSDFVQICTAAANRELAAQLKTLCLDPAEPVQGPWYFAELVSCLREFFAIRAADLLKTFRNGFAHTKLSRTVFAEIADVYELGGCVMLHNSAGNGKSYGAEACCAAHPGRARYVLVPATNNEVDFWRAIADALGTASGNSFKCDQIRHRAVQTLLGSGLVLVLDNSQWLFPVRDYRYALPQRLNQILQLAEQGVPIVMIAATKFFDMLGFVEARTGWDRSQFVNQLSRVVELPGVLEKDDVQTVAAALLPDGERAAQRKLADYMIVAQNYLHSGKHSAQRARRIAATNGRAAVTLADVEEALGTWMKPAYSDMEAALKRADVAASKSKSKVRNWRPDTDAQTAAKNGKRRNQIVTSSDLERATEATTEPVLKPISRPLKAPLRNNFPPRETVPAADRLTESVAV